MFMRRVDPRRSVLTAPVNVEVAPTAIDSVQPLQSALRMSFGATESSTAPTTRRTVNVCCCTSPNPKNYFPLFFLSFRVGTVKLRVRFKYKRESREMPDHAWCRDEQVARKEALKTPCKIKQARTKHNSAYAPAKKGFAKEIRRADVFLLTSLRKREVCGWSTDVQLHKVSFFAWTEC